jgi:hypothetical protein
VYVVKIAGANKENEVVLAMMAKMNHTLKTTGKQGVSSVFTNGIKGMVYIESRNEIDAKKLIEGLVLVKAWSFKLVGGLGNEMLLLFHLKLGLLPLVLPINSLLVLTNL